jgi:hypothetical protein
MVFCAWADDKRFEITLAGLTLTGDSGRVTADGLDGEVVGNATVTLPARADRTLIRHPGGGLVSGEEVVVTAERISIQNGLLLRARGGVVVTTRGERLDGRELDLLLRIADGEIRGNVLLNGSTPERRNPRSIREPLRFPPDIWELPPPHKEK